VISDDRSSEKESDIKNKLIYCEEISSGKLLFVIMIFTSVRGVGM
jgi:hypothetical protein